jgi:hypothetical protein
MHVGAGGAHDPHILVLGNIWVIIQLVLDVEAGRRHLKMKWAISQDMTAQALDLDLEQGSASTRRRTARLNLEPRGARRLRSRSIPPEME